MKPRCLTLGVVLGFFVFSGLVRAADEETSKTEESEAVVMEEVVVSATRYEQEVSSIPANTTVITEEDIANSTARDVPGILRTEVGIHVTDVTGNGRSYKVDLRGFGETAQTNTLVLVDGRRINGPDLSGTDWTLIPLDRIKRIEVIRGSRGSVLYGDNATGGVINIVTKEGDQFGVGVDVAGGSYDTFKANAYVNGSQNNFSYALTGRYYDSDGYRDNSATEAKDLGANLGYLFGDFMKLALSGGYHDDDTRMPGALTETDFANGVPRTGTVYPDDYSKTEDSYVQLNPEIFFFQNSLFQIPLSYRSRDTLGFSSFFNGTMTWEANTDIKTVSVSPQFVIKETVFGHNNNLTFGFDYNDAEEDIINTLTIVTPSTDEFTLGKENYGYYIHDEFFLLKALALSAGYRYDKVEYTFSPWTPAKKDYDENLFSAGIDYNFYKDSHVYFGFSQGFRYPVIDEHFDYTSNTINTNLVPQTSDNYEFGVRHHFTQTFYVNLNFFRIDTKDEIYYNPTGGPFGWGANENLDGETRRDGVEITLGKTFKNMTLRGSYTYTDAEITSGQFSGKELPAVPKHMASFDSVFDLGRGFTFTFNGKYVGELFFESDYANAFAKQDDYVVFNAKLQYAWKKFTTYLDVNNLFNEEYSEYGVLGGSPVQTAVYPSPERNFLVGVKFDY